MANWHPEWLAYVPFVLLKSYLQSSSTSEQYLTAVCLTLSFAESKGLNTDLETVQATANQQLESLITLFMEYGGIVVELASSRLTALFPYNEANHDDVIYGALRCGLLSAKTFAIKVGMSAGLIKHQSIGDSSMQLKSVIYGEVCNESQAAHELAHGGEIWVNERILEGMSDVTSSNHSVDVVQIVSIERTITPSPIVPTSETNPYTLNTLSRYMHPVIKQRIEAGQTQYLNEYRHITALHVRLSHLDVAKPEQIALVFNSLMQRINTFDGFLASITLYGKNPTVEILFGALITHENDEERALLCALEISRLSNISVAISVNSGLAYCGQIGSASRSEYAAKGNVINSGEELILSAQINQILVTDAIRNETIDQFIFERLLDSDQPTKFFRLRSKRETSERHSREPRYRTRMVGREQELEFVRQKLEQVKVGQGKIIGLAGEAGIGKSRLVAEIIKLAHVLDFEVYVGEGESHAIHTSYTAWRSIFQNLFALKVSQPVEEQIKHIKQVLQEIDPALVPRLPLLSTLLNLKIDDNDLTQNIDAEFQFELLLSLLSTFLHSYASQKRLLIVIEDAHWLDPISQQLLDYVGRNISDLPILLVVVYRLDTAPYHPLETLLKQTFADELLLREFSFAEANRLIRIKLNELFGGESKISDAISSRVMSHSQGNPFYIEEYMNYLHDLKINPSDTIGLQQIDLPNSLTDLIVSRMDKLTENEKTVLKVASVIGRLFRVNWLWGAYSMSALPPSTVIQENLDHLNDIELTLLHQSEPELEYIFKHVITQEVAYKSLTLATRHRLHEQIGEYIERTFPDDLATYTNILAHHYGLSSNEPRKIHYLRIAADNARETYANDSAIDYYQRLLPLISSSEKDDVMLLLGSVLVIKGALAEAESIFRQVIELAQGDSLQLGKALNELGNVLALKGEHHEASLSLEQAKGIFEQLDDKPLLGRSLEYLTFVYLRQAQYPQAIAAAEHQQQLAIELNDIRGSVEANLNIAWAESEQGNIEAAETHMIDASENAQRAGYKRGIIHSLGDLAAHYVAKGDYHKAMDNLRTALELALEIGHLHSSAAIIINMGMIYNDRGDFDRALICDTKSLGYYLELGDLPNVANALGVITIIEIEILNYEMAARLLDKSIKLCRSLNIPYILCEQLYYQAKLILMQNGNLDEARQLNDEALQIATDLGDHEYPSKCQILAIHLLVQSKEVNQVEAAERLNNLLNDELTESQQAAVHFELWRLDSNNVSAKQSATLFYKTLYEMSGVFEYRKRYKELTTQQLLPPSELPVLPQAVVQNLPVLEALLLRIPDID
ncbi:MAG: AAA family ATPase [Anaerolineaceae bacterium]|nr:AAA family ATPase [Anaerolineaceae bacterium]